MRGIKEGAIDIAGREYRTRLFTEGAFVGELAVEVPIGPEVEVDGLRAREMRWVPEAEARQALARLNHDLETALACLIDGLTEGYGIPRPVALRMLGELGERAVPMGQGERFILRLHWQGNDVIYDRGGGSFTYNALDADQLRDIDTAKVRAQAWIDRNPGVCSVDVLELRAHVGAVVFTAKREG